MSGSSWLLVCIATCGVADDAPPRVRIEGLFGSPELAEEHLEQCLERLRFAQRRWSIDPGGLRTWMHPCSETRGRVLWLLCPVDPATLDAPVLARRARRERERAARERAGARRAVTRTSRE